MMPNVLLCVCLGSIIFPLMSGLILTSNSSIAYTTGFTLICDVQGQITTSLTIADPSSTAAVQCFAPPNACGSVNTYNRDVAGGTLTVTILQSNVHTTNSVGSWSCTDGTSSVTYEVKEIVSFREPVVWSSSAEDGATVTVKFECIFPYPDEIKIEYVKANGGSSVMKTETGVAFTNGTASNCPVADARAISTEGTFTLSHSGLTESADVRVTAYLNGSALPSGYSNFTVTIVSTTTTSTTTPSPTTTNPSPTNKDYIIGGVVGGIGGLIIVCVIAFCCVRRSKNKNEMKKETEQTGESNDNNGNIEMKKDKPKS